MQNVLPRTDTETHDALKEKILNRTARFGVVGDHDRAGKECAKAAVLGGMSDAVTRQEIAHRGQDRIQYIRRTLAATLRLVQERVDLSR